MSTETVTRDPARLHRIVAAAVGALVMAALGVVGATASILELSGLMCREPQPAYGVAGCPGLAPWPAAPVAIAAILAAVSIAALWWMAWRRPGRAATAALSIAVAVAAGVLAIGLTPRAVEPVCIGPAPFTADGGSSDGFTGCFPTVPQPEDALVTFAIFAAVGLALAAWAAFAGRGARR